MEPPEIIQVDDDTDTASCDGGGGQLGHPTVYFDLSEGQADCYYCGRRFIKASKMTETDGSMDSGDAQVKPGQVTPG